jgi:membrane associated rhomboid family serine protease
MGRPHPIFAEPPNRSEIVGRLQPAKTPLKSCNQRTSFRAMLGDRAYMQGPSFGSRRSATAILVVINVVVFVLQAIWGFWGNPDQSMHLGSHRLGPGESLFALSASGLAHGYVWQLVTYQFMHGGPLHLLVNMLLVYFFGRAIEEALGSKTVVRLYLLSGAIGGLVQVLYQVLMQRVLNGFHDAPVVGASAAGLGLLAAFAALFPQRDITLLLFFFIPVSLRARTLLWITVGLAVFGMIVPMGNVAEAAHLGGIATGLAYIHWIVLGSKWPSLTRFKPPARPRVLVSAPFPKKSFWQRSKASDLEDLPPAEFISREVDPILDKISAYGIQSLTDRERRILEAARAKMAKR